MLACGHFVINVCRRNVFISRKPCKRHGKIARPAGDIQHLHAGLDGSAGNAAPLPESVHAETEEIVHQIVFFRHAVEHMAYSLFLFGFVDLAEAKINLMLFGS